MTTKRLSALVALAVFASAASDVAGLPTGAFAGREQLHIELKSSVPARDTVLTVPLDRVLLVFTGAVEARLSKVLWVGLGGDTVELAVSAAPDRSDILVAEAPPTAHGRQLLLWRTVSADGHQVSGEIPFTGEFPELAEPPQASVAANDTAGAAPVRQAGRMVETQAPTPGATSIRLWVRGLGLACLLAFAGLLWFESGTTLLIEPRPHRVASALGLGAAFLLSFDFLLWLNELRLPGASLADTLGIVIETRTGIAEAGRAGLAVLAFLAFTGTRAHRIGAGLAMLAVISAALGGHQATIEPLASLIANGLHVGAASVWLGGVVLLACWPGHGSQEGGGATGWTFPRVAARVSSAALLASGLVLLTGVVQDFLYLPGLSAVFSTDYGRLILVKAAGFAALVGFGAFHRFRLIPRLEEAGGNAALQRSVRIELLVMVAVVFVAVALAQTPPPVE